MPVATHATLLVLGGLLNVYSLAWSLDYRGWTSRVISGLFRRWGRWVWPGSERSYLALNRYIGWPCLAIGVIFVIAGATGWSA